MVYDCDCGTVVVAAAASATLATSSQVYIQYYVYLLFGGLLNYSFTSVRTESMWILAGSFLRRQAEHC